MPQATIHVFREKNGDIPLKEWLDRLEDHVPPAYEKILEGILYLEQHGYEADRPYVATLQQGIYEIRVKENRVHYRILFFYFKRNVICLSHGIIKKTDKVPPKEINKAIERMNLVNQDEATHIADWPFDEDEE